MAITGLLPNPAGADHDNKVVEIQSRPNYNVNATLTLTDANGSAYSFQATIYPNGVTRVNPTKTAFSLSNDGDAVTLSEGDGLITTVEYTTSNEGLDKLQ